MISGLRVADDFTMKGVGKDAVVTNGQADALPDRKRGTGTIGKN